MAPRRVTAPAVLLGLIVCAPAARSLADVAPAGADAPAVTIRSVAEGKKLMAAAQKDVDRLRGTVDRRQRQLEVALRAMPEYRQSVAERARARTAYEAARQPALAAVRTSEAYHDAQARLARANAALAAASRNARLGVGAMRSLSADVRESSAAVREIESHAAAAYPPAAEAAEALQQADARVASLRQQHVEQALADDQVCMSARSSLTRAEMRLAALSAEVERLRKGPEDETLDAAPLPATNDLRSRLRPRYSVEDYARGLAMQRAIECSGPV